jgi:hypothetical protein
MSVQQIIANYFTAEPEATYLVSPRRGLPFTGTVALAGGAQVALAVGTALEILAPSDGLWFEAWTGLIFGDAVANSTFTINSFACQLNNVTPNFLMVLGQPTFTLLTAAGSAAAVPELTFSIDVATPFLSYNDIATAAAQIGRPVAQPLQLEITMAVLNGAAASHLTCNGTLLYRKVSGVPA